MSIERIFLDWKSPCLPQAADWLISRARDGRYIDLRGNFLVLPGSRALRRLTELLVEKSEQAGKSIVLPDMGTAGQLPELLYISEEQSADSLERHLAWMQALRESEMETIAAFIRRPPDYEDTHAWFLIAQRIDRLHREIGSAAHDFSSVAKHCRSTSTLYPDDRWDALAGIEKKFHQVLSDLHRADIEQQRRNALAAGASQFNGSLVLIGVSELPRITRDLLRANRSETFALVHAPKDQADLFDELGCVNPAAWNERAIQIPEPSLSFARNPAEQAQAALAMLASLQASLPAEEITIGCCSRDAKPFILEALGELDIPARDASGVAIENTPPVVFLRLLADYLSSRSFRDFATLLRQPQLHSVLLKSKELRTLERSHKSLLEALDRYHNLHLQSQVSASLPNINSSARVPALAVRALHALLGSLTESARPLSEWASEITRVLIQVFGTRRLNAYIEADALVIQACEAIHEQLAEMHELQPAQHTILSASEAIRLVLSQVAGQSVEIGGTGESIEVLGWLELHLDDAEALVITSLNEGYTPESINSDPFLPNSLRTSLGLLDNERRYARDAYYLTAITQGRRFLKLAATRLDAQGSPLKPSRLLLADRGEVIARRIQSFFESTKERRVGRPQRDGARRLAQPPRPVPLEAPPSCMKVTSFKDYITCPYRFYLRHIAKLEVLDDSALELDSAATGTLLHSVLTAFGQSSVHLETDPERIAEFLLESFAQQFLSYFGTKPLSTLFVQRLQAEARLREFATWQAGWAAQGWEIRETEYMVAPERAVLKLENGNHMELLGRIDRIDYNPRSQEWFVFDYKTGERGESPDKTHRRRKKWADLQLPLYRYLAERSDFAGAIKVGFILLPADLKDCKGVEAAWSDGEYHDAIREAARIAGLVRNQVFWPPQKLPSSAYDDYRLIVAHEFGQAVAEEVA